MTVPTLLSTGNTDFDDDTFVYNAPFPIGAYGYSGTELNVAMNGFMVMGNTEAILMGFGYNLYITANTLQGIYRKFSLLHLSIPRNELWFLALSTPPKLLISYL